MHLLSGSPLCQIGLLKYFVNTVLLIRFFFCSNLESFLFNETSPADKCEKMGSMELQRGMDKHVVAQPWWMYHLLNNTYTHLCFIHFYLGIIRQNSLTYSLKYFLITYQQKWLTKKIKLTQTIVRHEHMSLYCSGYKHIHISLYRLKT